MSYPHSSDCICGVCEKHAEIIELAKTTNRLLDDLNSRISESNDILRMLLSSLQRR